MTKKAALKPVIVSHRMQLGFLGVFGFYWLSTILSDLLSMHNRVDFITNEMWLTYAMSWGLPLLYVLITIPFAWRHYRGTLTRWFTAAWLGLLALLTTFGVLALASAIQYRWFLSVGTYDPSAFWNTFGQQWLIILLCVTLYIGVLGTWEWRIKHRR